MDIGKRAAGYVRMSTSGQEASPKEQRAEIQKLAKREGYQIVKWFCDEGISGNATRRPGFEQMQDAATVGEFDVVVCWDLSRFTRKDLISACKDVAPFQDAGVTLHSINDGLIDFDDPDQHWLLGPKFSMSHSYLKQLSTNVTRAFNTLAGEGQWVFGKPPLGYTVGEDRRLYPGDPKDVETIQQAFDLYANKGLSLREVAGQLAELTGRTWNSTSLSRMFRNKVYIGVFTANRHTYSKFKKRKKDPTRRPKSQWIVLPNNHEPIIEAKVFRKAQDRLDNNQAFGRGGSTSPLFTGLLTCAHCGRKMTSQQYSTKGGKVRGYVCRSWANNNECDRNYIKESELVEMVLDALGEQFFSPKEMQRIEASLVRQLTQPEAKQVTQETLEKLRAKRRELEQKLVAVSIKRTPIVERELDAVEERILQVQAALNLQQATAATVEAVRERVLSCLAMFDRLKQLITDPELAREAKALIHELISGIELTMVVDRVTIAGRKSYVVELGKIQLIVPHKLQPTGRPWSR